MKIGIGSDHGGFELKEQVKAYLVSLKLDVVDCGCFSKDSCDYPVMAQAVASKVSTGEFERGVLICTTGIGMSISVNRYPNVRAALVTIEDMCKMTRLHNNANVL